MEIDNYQKLRVLGQGTYGKCYLALNRSTGEQCVLKQIEIFGLTQDEINESVREAHILEALDSDYIIKFLASFQSKEGHLNIIMAFAQGGDLSQRIRDTRLAESTLPQEQILRWFTQMCLAIKHVHDRKIIHRDLKAQNIFLTGSGEVKLGDFGIARHLQHTIQKTKSMVGTPYYMAPEICENKEYSFKADIWSLGVILLEMCLLRPPFDANSLPVLALRISKGEHFPVPRNYSRELRKLVTEMLQVDAGRRPSINEVLRHPLIEPRIAALLPRDVRDREFSHTTLHAINIFDKAPSRGLFIDCAVMDSSPSPSPLDSVRSPKSVQGSQKSQDMPVRRVDNYTKQSSKPQKKAKKPETRKREFSEPNLTPKGHMKIENERRLYAKGSVAVVEKKKQKEGIFKKKSRNPDIYCQVAEIYNMKQEIKEMGADIKQESTARPRKETEFQEFQEEEVEIVEKRPKMLVKEDLEEAGEEDEDREGEEEQGETCPKTHRQAPEPTSFKAVQKEETLLQTLEALILEQTNQTDLSDLYKSCQENQGICLLGPCAGLLTLAYALKQEIY